MRTPSHGGEFVRALLPDPQEYFSVHELKLIGAGNKGWKSAKCPFHEDGSPSLSVNINTGGFFCHACGARGGDILAFHMKRYGLRFVDAAKGLGAWRQSTDYRGRDECRA